jgi:AcrR family transcriptional regulator
VASTAKQPRAGVGRLNSDDWLRAALDIMVDDGIEGVKIHRLCERLGVTKGSFYWHFADLDAFLGELARRWTEEGVRMNGSMMVTDDPAQGLLRAMRMFSDRRNRNLTRAMRDWAHRDARAREAIHQADEALLKRVAEVLQAVGFTPADAELRAKILYYAGIGFAHAGSLGKRSSAEAELAAAWELLTRVPE